MGELTRRGFIKLAGAAAAITALPNYVSAATNKKAVAGTGGNHYVPYDRRKSPAAFVYFTRDLSANGLVKIFDRVKGVLAGKTNTYYDGERYHTADHRKTLDINGWNFCPVDIMDEDGTTLLPVPGGKWFNEMSMGKDILNYDSFLALTHFKGHAMGGFGGSDKNIGIGCADGRIGKKWIHTAEGQGQWSIAQEEFMERMTESTKAITTYFAHKIAFINVLRNMSVSCDCEGVAAAPVVTPNIGIVASLDILAADQASVDLVYALPETSRHALVERIESRHGLRQLSYMLEMGMGNDRYHLIDIDNGDAEISASDAVKGISGKWISDGQ